MGLFTNPLSHAGYPPGVTGTPSTQPSEVRAATAAEAIAGTLNNVYISPATMAGSGGELGPRTAHGVIIGEGTSSPLGATAAGTAGQLLTSGGASSDPVWTTATYPATATAGDILYASAANVIGKLADVATGQALMSGGVGVAPGYSGSPSFSGSVTAATSITATAGDITATLGNVILNGAAKQLRVKGGAVTDFVGQAVLVNGTVTVANTNIAATDRILVTRSAKNASTAYGSFQVVITASTNFVITSCKSDTTTETNDASTVDYFIFRQV